MRNLLYSGPEAITRTEIRDEIRKVTREEIRKALNDLVPGVANGVSAREVLEAEARKVVLGRKEPSLCRSWGEVVSDEKLAQELRREIVDAVSRQIVAEIKGRVRIAAQVEVLNPGETLEEGS